MNTVDESRWSAFIAVGDDDGPRVLALVERAAELGARTVILDGHHLFTRVELLPWAARASSLGLDLRLATDGPLPIPAGRVDRLSRLGLRGVTLALDGVADEGYPAIAPLLSPRLGLTVEHAVTGPGETPLRAMIDWLLPLEGITLGFVLTDGGVAGAAAIAAAIAYGDARVATLGAGPRFAHRGAPLCVLDGFDDRRDDRHLGWVARRDDSDFGPVTDGEMVQPPICAGCASAGACPGLHRTQLAGAHRLRPRSDGARSNSFTYRAERTLEKGAGGACPIYSAPRPYHAARHLLLDDGAQVIVHRAATHDFSDGAIDRVKHDLGQLYLDRCDKPAPDDFARDLAKLTLSTMCRACDRRAGCAGTWSVVSGDLFTVADQRVRDRVAEVARRGGRVVDVGCGDGRYGDLLEPAARAHTLRYLGIEPDRARADALAARWPWAELRALPVEQLTVEEPIDALLVLRSWNHLAHPARDLGPAIAALREGGLLLVVDNVAFGLVRTREQTARAESPSSPARFEHYRNDCSTDALATLSALPLDLIEHDPVTPDGSNQWLLAFRKK